MESYNYGREKLNYEINSQKYETESWCFEIKVIITVEIKKVWDKKSDLWDNGWELWDKSPNLRIESYNYGTEKLIYEINSQKYELKVIIKEVVALVWLKLNGLL